MRRPPPTRSASKVRLATRTAHPLPTLIATFLLATTAACGQTDGESPGDPDAAPDLAASTAADDSAREAATPAAPAATATVFSSPPDVEPPPPTPLPPTTQAPLTLCLVDTSALNVREGPGTRFDSLGVVLQGVEIEALERLADCSWLHVRVGDTDGWLGTAFVSCPFDPCSLPVAESIPPTYTPSPTPTPTATLPPSIAFSSNLNEVPEGECAELRWSASEVTALSLDGDTVPLQGTLEVCPTIDTEYTLRWSPADAGSDHAVVTIRVLGVGVPGGIPRVLATPPLVQDPRLSPGIGVPSPLPTLPSIRVPSRRP